MEAIAADGLELEIVQNWSQNLNFTISAEYNVGSVKASTNSLPRGKNRNMLNHDQVASWSRLWTHLATWRMNRASLYCCRVHRPSRLSSSPGPGPSLHNTSSVFFRGLLRGGFRVQPGEEVQCDPDLKFSRQHLMIKGYIRSQRIFQYWQRQTVPKVSSRIPLLFLSPAAVSCFVCCMRLLLYPASRTSGEWIKHVKHYSSVYRSCHFVVIPLRHIGRRLSRRTLFTFYYDEMYELYVDITVMFYM